MRNFYEEDGILYKFFDGLNYWSAEKVVGLVPNTVRIVSYINDFPVKIIQAKCFQNNANIITVLIPDTIEIIGENAFANCELLQTVKRYVTKSSNFSKPTRISQQAFYRCTSLTTFQFYGNLIDLSGPSGTNYQNFDGCINLSDFHASLVNEVPTSAFRNCLNLQKLTFFDDIKISERAFSGCGQLEVFEFQSGNLDASESFWNYLRKKKVFCHPKSNLNELAYNGCQVCCSTIF